MRYLFLLLLYVSLQGAGFWTLSGVDKANVYVSNELSILNAQTVVKIKEKMKKRLEENGIKTELQDSPTLMVSMVEISDDEAYFVYIKLALGEEVKTFREDKSETFALTYDAYDFIEVDEESIDNDVLESIDFLLDQFSEHYEDDKE